MMKTTTLRHSKTGNTITIFAANANHYYADWSNLPELEWLGGPTKARDFIAIMLSNGGYVKAVKA